MDRKHYSYRVYRDRKTAESFDDLRFGGPVGLYFREHQEHLIEQVLPDVREMLVLDIGAGTGRTAVPLSHRGAYVVAADASLEMLRVTKEKSFLQGGWVRCVQADAHRLPFADRCFPAVLSFRMLMHVPDWRRALSEICRVSSKFVIIDFPPKMGFAGLAPVVHPILNVLKSNHQPYRVFSVKNVLDVLNSLEFEPALLDRHVVLPFGFHRLIGSRSWTEKVESFLAKIGFRDLFGAPVTIVAKRVIQT